MCVGKSSAFLRRQIYGQNGIVVSESLMDINHISGLEGLE